MSIRQNPGGETMCVSGSLTELAPAPLAAGNIFDESVAWMRIFPAEVNQLGTMRRWLASLLPDSPARDDVLVIANELATNAIQHTTSGRSGFFAVEITARCGVLRIAIADAGSTSEPALLPSGCTDESGRGLLIVRGLSTGLGMCGDHHGRLVWADLPICPPPVTHADYGAGERALRQLREDGVI